MHVMSSGLVRIPLCLVDLSHPLVVPSRPSAICCTMYTRALEQSDINIKLPIQMLFFAPTNAENPEKSLTSLVAARPKERSSTPASLTETTSTRRGNAYQVGNRVH